MSNEFDLMAIFVKNSAHREVCWGISGETYVVNSMDRCCEHTWSSDGVRNDTAGEMGQVT